MNICANEVLILKLRSTIEKLKVIEKQSVEGAFTTNCMSDQLREKYILQGLRMGMDFHLCRMAFSLDLIFPMHILLDFSDAPRDYCAIRAVAPTSTPI